MIRSAFLTIILFPLITIQHVHGGITGFGDGTGFTLNHNSNATPSISAGTLTLTNASGPQLQAASAFYNTRQSTGSFTASFTYQANGDADGITFVLQNDPAGPAALGGAGSGLGYALDPSGPAKIIKSVGLEVNIYSFTDAGTLLETQGTSGIFSYLPTSPVNLDSGDPIRFSLTYDATAQTLMETLLDTLSLSTYSHTFTGINFASAVGSNSAYVGFTGGVGGITSTQTISNFAFTSAVPEPTSVVLVGLGLGIVVNSRWFRRKKSLV